MNVFYKFHKPYLVFFHRFLQRRIDELVVGMEQEAIKLVEVVQGDRDVDLVEGRA